MSGDWDGGHQLLDALRLAVPLEIQLLRDADPEQRAALAAALRSGGRLIAGADAMMYGGSGGRETFAGFVRAIAAEAFQPGGVKVGPIGFCAVHRWPDGQPECRRCLADEAAAKAAG